MTIKTIFLDRDGVINKDMQYLYKIDEFIFIDGIIDACIHFEKIGYKIVIVTNQSGIYRNMYTENDYKKLNQWMLSQFNNNNIQILDTYHCPHGPKSNCNCRKPKPGMLIKAQIQYNIDMENSWMIGDKERDISAASLAGISNTILFHESQDTVSKNTKAKFTISLLEQVKKIITR